MRKDKEFLVKNQEAILKLINEDPRLSAEKLGLELGLSKQGVRYHLDKLKASGLIRYVGSSKAGYWEILE